MNAKDDAVCRNLAASSVVGMPIRAALEELDALRAAVKPFARLVSETNGRIPTERLSFADWHALAKAAAMTPNDRVEGRDAASSRRVPSHDGLCGNGPEVGAGETAAEMEPARDIHSELTLAAFHREVAK